MKRSIQEEEANEVLFKLKLIFVHWLKYTYIGNREQQQVVSPFKPKQVAMLGVGS